MVYVTMPLTSLLCQFPGRNGYGLAILPEGCILRTSNEPRREDPNDQQKQAVHILKTSD